MSVLGDVIGGPMVDFHKFKIGVQSTMNSAGESFQIENAGPLKNLCPQIAAEIAKHDTADPLQSPILFELMATFRRVFDAEVTSAVYSKWPPGGNLTQDAETVLAFMSQVISISEDPVKAMNWLASAMSSVVMDLTSKVNSRFQSIGVCRVNDKKSKEKHWMYITRSGELVVARGKEEVVRVESPELEIGQGAIHVKNGGQVERLYPIDAIQLILWKQLVEKREPAFPQFLTSISLPLAKDFCDAFVECLTASDLAVIHTIASMELKWKKDGARLAEAIIDVFEYNGKIDPLMCFLFSDGLGATENVFYSLLLKLIFRRASSSYFDNIIWRIIEHVEGTMSQNTNLEAMIPKAIEIIVRSDKFISREIRQIASILMHSAIRKDNQKATVLALLVELFLQFITPVLKDPLSYDPSLQLTPELQRTLQPFADLLGKALRLISGGNPHDKLLESVPIFYYEQLRDFLFSITTYEGGAEHAVVTTEKYQESVLIVLSIICSADNFSSTYARVLTETNTHSSLSLHYCSLLASNFRLSGRSTSRIQGYF